jgi:hypothetical protein
MRGHGTPAKLETDFTAIVSSTASVDDLIQESTLVAILKNQRRAPMSSDEHRETVQRFTST